MQMTKNVEKEYLLLRIMTFVRYFGDCLFYGYFILFLESRGLDGSSIGIVSALTPIVALASNPLWSHLSKNANHNRKIMIIITILEGIAILVFTQVSIFELIALLTVMVALVGSPFYSLHDGFIGTFAKTYKKDYTRIRFLGTIAYFAASLFAAFILKITSDNYNWLLVISGSLFILVSLFFLQIKPIDLSLTKDGEKVQRNYKAIFLNGRFIVYMIVFFLVNTISFAADNYVGLYFTKHHGLTSSMWSLIFASFLLVEFFVMLVLSRKNIKLNLNIIWIIISILYPLRSLIFALDLPLPISIAAASFRGISYGLLLVANIRCVEKICGIENVTAAFFIMGIFTAIIQALSNFVFGNVIESIGFNYFFLIVSLCGFLGMIINLIFQFSIKFEYDKKTA